MSVDMRFLKGDHIILRLGDDVFSDIEAEVTIKVDDFEIFLS